MNSLDYILDFVIASKETELHNYLNECIEYVKANITKFYFEVRNENNKTTGDCIIFSMFGTSNFAYVYLIQ